MMNCKQATRLLSERMERPLTAKEKVALTMHITICSGCKQFGKQMKELRNISKCYMKEENKHPKK